MFPSGNHRFQIEKGEQFVLLTINRANIDISEDVEIEKDFWVLQKCPISIVDHWKDWLGTLQTGEIENADLVIVSKSKVLKPEIPDEQNEELWEKVMIYYQLMTLIGICNFTSGNIVSGTFAGDFPEIKKHGMPPNYFRSGEYKNFRLEDFQATNEIFKKSAYLYKDENKDRFARLKRGLQAFFDGMAEDEVGNRIHQVVRSIEGVVYPPIGKTRENFSSRCAFLAQNGEMKRADFEEIYDLRSCIEHLHEIENYEKFKPEIKALTISDQQTYFLKRLYQAEEFSGFLYKKIILSNDLLPFFETNEGIDRLWKRLESGDANLGSLFRR